MDNTVKFVSSTRGKEKACNNGYVYYFDKRSKTDKEINFYICEEYKKLRCPARIHVRHNEVIDRSKEHNHAPDRTRPSVLNVLSAIRSEAYASAESPVAILADKIAVVPPAVAAGLPHSNNLRRTIQRVRQRKQKISACQPESLHNITPPEHQTHVVDYDSCLLYNSGLEDHNIPLVIFGTERMLRFLKNSLNWNITGIRDIAPTLYCHLITIHASSKNFSLPAVYALMSANNEHCYSLLFNELSELAGGLAPQTISCDFDHELINAARVKFLDASIIGSHFNLRQNLNSKIQSMGYVSLYQEEEEFAAWVRCLPALAFVPIDDVGECFKALTEDKDFKRIVDERAEDLVDYFEDTFIGRPRIRHGGRKKPSFPIEFWNLRDNAIQGQCFCDDVIEKWVDRMNRLVGIRDSNILALIDELRGECKANMYILEQTDDEIEPKTKCVKIEIIDTEIQEIVREYDAKGFVQFLKKVGGTWKT